MKIEIKLNEEEYKIFNKKIREIAINYKTAIDLGKPELAESFLSAFDDQDRYNKNGGIILLTSN